MASRLEAIASRWDPIASMFLPFPGTHGFIFIFCPRSVMLPLNMKSTRVGDAGSRDFCRGSEGDLLIQLCRAPSCQNGHGEGVSGGRRRVGCCSLVLGDLKPPCHLQPPSKK